VSERRPAGPASELLDAADLRGLAARALEGDARAWEAIVERLSGVVWKVVNSYRLSAADRDDAYASTFYRLYDKLATVRDPAALPGWVATTARNEVHALVRSHGRQVPTASLPLREIDPGDHDTALLDDEVLSRVMAAFADLPPKHQALLRLLTADPPLSYEEIGRVLEMKHGSIGPTRGRCLEQIRVAVRPYLAGG
jgi:RNA polymerase sigma factor (sigma-70 family)